MRDDSGRFVRSHESPSPTSKPTPASLTANTKGNKRARQSWDDAFQSMGSMPFVLQPPLQSDQTWVALKLDDSVIDTMPPERLLSMLIDLSPDISRGLWDFLRLFNPGRDITAFIPGTDDPDPVGQKMIDDFLTVLDDRHGSVEVIFNRLAAGCFLRGAFLAELVLDDQGRKPLDIATPDPSTIRFRRITDPVLGPQWQMIQYHSGTITLLDRPTIRYVPIDPMPGNPYGRPLCSPAMFVSLFLLGFLRDLRRVVAQQGYPRHDIEVLVSEAAKQLTMTEQRDKDVVKEWIAATMDEVASDYYALDPDMAFIHTDAVRVNNPAGAVDSSSLGAVDPLMRMLERMAIKALKSMPILSGMAEGTTETNANRQWEIQASSMRSMQRLCGTMLSRHFSMVTQVQGHVSDVRCTFLEIRSSEEVRDETTLQLKLANAKLAYELGYYSQEQASLHAVDTDPDQSAPRAVANPAAVVAPSAMPPEPDPGSKKSGNVARAINDGRPSDDDKATLMDAWDALLPEEYSGLLAATVS